MLKQTSSFYAGFGKFFCLLILLALFSTNFVAPIKSNQINDLVYCPLQKTWVKAHIEKVSQNDTFKNICATDKKKAELFAELALKTSQFQRLTESVLFEYLEKGKLALTNNFPNLPNGEIVSHRSFETEANNYQHNFIEPQHLKITLPQLSRPPNYQISNKFDSQITRKLNKISRRINPRSPPVFS